MDEDTTTPPAMERRIVSVLFADLVGFTTLSEALDAEDIAAVQDAYFSGIRDAARRHGGRLEKFIGDAAVVAFGADRTREDDAERAVRCGLAIVALVGTVGARLGFEVDALRVRVGIQTGEVAVATAGPDAGRLTGDTMNTAARLQAAADPGRVLVGRPTVLAAEHVARFGPLRPLPLKGKAGAVSAAPVMSLRPEVSRAAAMGDLGSALVGREAELEELAGALRRARSGSTERWTVVADPGVGKSRLLGELRSLAEPLAVAWWPARVRAGETAPFEALAALVRAASGQASDLGSLLRAAGVPPERASVLADEATALMAPIAPGRDADRELADARDARFHAWLELLDGLAAGRPQVLLVEDAHWAGGDLLAFLALAGSVPAPAGRLVVVTARPTLPDARPGWIDARGGRRLDLAPLGRLDAAMLVRGLAGDALPDRLVTAIVARSDGNPLFIEELLRSWASLGVLVRHGDAWHLAVEPAEVPMPETVQALYAAQLDDLPGAAREVARRASVAGRRVPGGVLPELGLEDGHIAEGLAMLRRGTLLDGPWEDVTVGPSYAFRHALLRDAGYASLARAERARLHVAVARWLASLPVARGFLGETIGRQLVAAADATSVLAGSPGRGPDQASLRAEAAGWFAMAAEQALAFAAHDAAVAMLRESLELTDPAATLVRAGRTARLGVVLAATGSLDEAAALLGDARAAYVSLLGGPERGDARDGYSVASADLGRLHLERLRFDDAIDVARGALAMIGPGAGTEPAISRLELTLAHADLYATNRATPALDVAARVAAAARVNDQPELELDALRLELSAASDLGSGVEAIIERIVELAESLGRWPLVIATRINQAASLLGGRTAEMGPLLDVAERMARSRGLLQPLAWIAQGRAEVAFLVGDWDEAMRRGQEGLAVATAHGYQRAAVRTWFVLRPIAAYRGDSATLADLGAWMRELAGAPDSPYGRLMHDAIDLDVAASTGADPRIPDTERLAEAWTLGYGDPSFVAARDTVLGSWWAAGRFDDVVVALDGMPAASVMGPLGHGSALLWRARLARDEAAAVDLARQALRALRKWGAAWWISSAIAILDDAGVASTGERAERRMIEGRLLGAGQPA